MAVGPVQVRLDHQRGKLVRCAASKPWLSNASRMNRFAAAAGMECSVISSFVRHLRPRFPMPNLHPPYRLGMLSIEAAGVSPPVNLRTLSILSPLPDAGSFTGAASIIPLAQPALTRQMRELEADWGCSCSSAGRAG